LVRIGLRSVTNFECKLTHACLSLCLLLQINPAVYSSSNASEIYDDKARSFDFTCRFNKGAPYDL
jgi:hypothetical protein